MSELTKNQRINQIADQLARQQGAISMLTIMVKEQNEAILMLEKLTDEKLRDQPEPQLKTLDQSVFDGLDDGWKFAAIDRNGDAFLHWEKPTLSMDVCKWCSVYFGAEPLGLGYDATDWQNSLIERDKAELTGSDLCRAMLARGDKWVVCAMADTNESDAIINSRPRLVTHYANGFFEESKDMYWHYAVPINNQGEPLTASEVRL